MKKTTKLITVLTLSAMNAFAQIPNSDFENWTNKGSYNDLNGWATMNQYCTGPFYSCTKSTDHYPSSIGSYSMRIENNTSLGQTTGGWGIAVTDTMAYPFQPTFPIVGHPTSLTGYVKYNGLNGDTASIGLVMFNNGIQVFHESESIVSTGGNWASFNFTFPTYTTADSATILVMAYKPNGPTDSPNGNSVLYVDNLNFDNLITSLDDLEINNEALKLFPNPTSDYFTLDFDNPIEFEAIVNIYDVVGKLVSSEQLLNGRQQINVSSLNEGIYMIEIKLGDWSTVKKLSICRK